MNIKIEEEKKINYSLQYEEIINRNRRDNRL